MAREVTHTEKREIGLVLAGIRERMGRSVEAGAVVGFLAVAIFFIIATSFDTNAEGKLVFQVIQDGKFYTPQILTPRSVSSVITNAASYGILAVGVTILMIAGEFDLSVGSILGLSALVFIIATDSGLGGLAQMVLPHSMVEKMGLSFAGFSGLVAIAITLTAGALMGAINGLLLVTTRIPSFIVTLGTLYIYRSVMYNIIPGGTIARFNRDPIMVHLHPLVIIVIAAAAWGFVAFLAWPGIQSNFKKLREGGNGWLRPIIRLVLMSGILAFGVLIVVNVIDNFKGDFQSIVAIDFFDILNGKLTDLPGNYLAAIVWWFLLAAAFQVVLTHTRFGNAVFATGGNPGAALAQGIRVKRIKVAAFMLSGIMAAVGGMMEVARFKVVEPLRGTGYELDVIAAAVIGGTLLTGGYGSIIGALLGVLISGILKTGLVLIGVDATWYRGVLGMIMIIAVIINTNIRRQR